MNFKAVAKVLSSTASTMESTPGLDADGALRRAVWGTENAGVPRGQTSDTDLYDDASSLICGYGVNPADPNSEPYSYVGDVPRQDAIRAAKAEARRFNRY